MGPPRLHVLYFLPAGFGWPMCRVLSAILTAWSAWFAYRIAGRAGIRPAWVAVPLCYLQPLFFQLAQTTLTETALAFYLTRRSISPSAVAGRGRPPFCRWASSAARGHRLPASVDVLQVAR